MRHKFTPAAIVVLIGLSTLASAQRTPRVHANVDTQTKAANPNNFVGAEVCAACHQTEANGFANNPHAKMVFLHGDKGVTCENCHGPGEAHVESGGTTRMFDFNTAPAKAVDAQCLSCHAGAHPNFLRSPHARAGVSCTSCHSIHAAKTEVSLLKAPQPTLCYQCHTDIKPQFDMPFHHPVNEGVVKCTDCHDPHGTFGNHQLRSTADQNMICTKCHTEVAGPFVYEHPVVKTEGCLACHSPHGSPNARLLNVSNLNSLCLQCHSATNSTAFPNALSPTGPVHNQMSNYVACTNCHTQIHGSNASDLFFK